MKVGLIVPAAAKDYEFSYSVVQLKAILKKLGLPVSGKKSMLFGRVLSSGFDVIGEYLGMLRQVNGYNARKSICRRVESLFLQMDGECTKIKLGTN